MLIFLGKVVLHQTEFPEEEKTPTKVEIIFETSDEASGPSANQWEVQDELTTGE